MRKKLLSAMLSLCLTAGMMVYPCSMKEVYAAKEQTQGDYTYQTLDNGTAEITGYSGKDAVLSIPSEIGGKKVVRIGDEAFSRCKGLKNVTISEYVTTIGDEAFSGCTGLIEIDIPLSVTKIERGAFEGCTALTGDPIPSSVTSIEGDAFRWCTSLTSISIPNGVTSIEDYTFTGCKNLQNISIPANVTNIGMGAFAGCESLRDIPTMTGVTNIGSEAFSGCTGLTVAEIPGSVTKIEGSAFRYCTNLTEIKIPNSVKEIEYCAFDSCTSLEKVNIPASVDAIGTEAFANCTSLKSITVDEKNTSYTSEDGVLYEKDKDNKTTLISCPGGKQGHFVIPGNVTEIAECAFEGCQSLESVEIPASITKIADYTFSFCLNLKRVSIPESVKELGLGAFANCMNLESIQIDSENKFYLSEDGVLYSKDRKKLILCPNGKQGNFVIPDGVVSIGEYAFNGCSDGKGNSSIYDGIVGKGCIGLESITIPSSVSNIGNGAFYGCTGRKNITIPSSVSDIGNYVFSGCIGLESIDADENNMSFSSVEGVLYNKDKTKLIACPEGKQGNFVIPDSVTDLDYDIFRYCTNLKSISIPDSIDSITALTDIFSECTGLESLNVNTSHPKYSSADGVIYSKDGKELVFCPKGKQGSFVIPDGVTRISEKGFYNCKYLTDVTIPASLAGTDYLNSCTGLTAVNVSAGHPGYSSVNGVLYNKEGDDLLYCPRGRQGSFDIPDSVICIEEDAFSGCAGLKNITIPVSVTRIENSAFYGCSGLTDINYAGSKEQWENILIRSYNDTLLAATIHYASDDSEKETKPVVIIPPNPPVPDIEDTVPPVPDIKDTVPPAPDNKDKVPPAPDNKDTVPPVSNTDTTQDNQSTRPQQPVTANPELTDPINKKDDTVAADVSDKSENVLKKGERCKFGKNFYSVTKTGSEVMFVKTSARQNVTIPASITIDGISYKVTAIKAKALYGNQKIKKITIGKNIKTIGNNAFRDCEGMKKITIKSLKLKKVGKSALKGIHPKAKIKVPSGKIRAYRKLLRGKGQGMNVKIME